MALPTVAVQFGFGQSIGTAKGSVAWTDVTDYVRLASGLSFSRGRTAVGQAPSAGTLSLALANNDGRFTPSTSMLASDGAYSSDFYTPDDYDTSPGVRRVQTRIPVRIQAYVDPFDADFDGDFGDTIDLWYGFVTDVEWNPGADITAKFQAADILAQAGKVKCRPWLTGRHLSATPTPTHYWPLTDIAGTEAARTAAGTDDDTLAVREFSATPSVGFDFGVVSDLSPDEAETVAAFTPTYGTSSAGGGKVFEHAFTVPATGDVVVSLWFRITRTISAGDALHPLLAILDKTSDQLPIVFVGVNDGDGGDPNRNLWVQSDGTGAFDYTYGAMDSVPLDEWHHLLFARDQSQTGSFDARTIIYVDGVLMASSSATFGSLTTLTPGDTYRMIIGGQTPISTTAWLSGQLGHLALFDDATDAAALAAHLYNNGTGAPTAADRFEELPNVTAQPTGVASWMAADSTADILIAQQSSKNVPLIELGQQIASTERGNLIATHDGFLRLVSSRSRLTETIALTLDARTDVLSFEGAFAIDDADAVDEVSVTAQPSGATFRGERVGGASLESATQDVWSDNRIHAQAVADGVANYPLDIPKSPRLSVSMEWMTYAGYTEEVLSLELGDLIRVTNLPLSAPSSTVDLVVEAIDHQVGTNDWIITFDTSPGELAAGGVVGTSGTLSTVATTLTVRP